MWHACGKQYSACVTCMLWWSKTESVPLLVSNIDDIFLVHSQYVLLCTCLYYYTFYVPVCTRYVLVRTGSKPVHTKYPIPVMRFTIPDETKARSDALRVVHYQTKTERTCMQSADRTCPRHHCCVDLHIEPEVVLWTQLAKSHKT